MQLPQKQQNLNHSKTAFKRAVILDILMKKLQNVDPSNSKIDQNVLYSGNLKFMF